MSKILETLIQRSESKCELCLATAVPFSVYPVLPAKHQSAANSLYLCQKCIDLMGKSDNHWRCLSQTIWSEVPAVVVVAWRILGGMSDQAWAKELFEQIYLDDENLKWAQAGIVEAAEAAEVAVSQTRDSNGNLLNDGDSVTLIKDLEVKGAGFTAKRGTLVRNISLAENPLHVEGKVNGVQIVLVAAYLKKA